MRSHTGFRLVSKLVAVSDIERPDDSRRALSLWWLSLLLGWYCFNDAWLQPCYVEYVATRMEGKELGAGL